MPGERILNWGLLSTARINRALIPALNASPRNRLRAVASRSPEAAQAYAREWGIERAFGSYEALLADPEVDVVYIPLPNRLHAEWSIRALQAGKHVLCEKPLALSLQEVDAMAAAAGESDRVLAEAFMYRHAAQTARVMELVQSGAVGALQAVNGAFTFTLNRPADIRWNKALGGGSIWDVGSYPISYARMVTGKEPLEVFAWQVMIPGGVDVYTVGQMRFPGDVFAHFEASFVSPPRSHMEIVGSEGILSIPVPFKPGALEKLTLRRGDDVQVIEVQAGPLYAGEVEDMADAVLLGRQPHITLTDSRGNIAAITALIRSAQERAPVIPG